MNLSPEQWMGQQPVRHTIPVSSLGSDFITAGRVYVEYRMRGFYISYGKGLLYSKVQKRFFDIDGYIEPAGKSLVERHLGWVIAGLITAMIAVAVFVRNCCWKENVRAR